MTEAEAIEIENSRQALKQHQLELEEKNEDLERALVEEKERTLQARDTALAATSRQLFQTDPTMAMRLAEAACKTTEKPSKEAQSAFMDVISEEIAFYKSM